MIRATIRGVVASVVCLATGCSSQPTPEQYQATRYTVSKDGGHRDIDVSGLPDAVPKPHHGKVKAAPYSLFGKTYYPLAKAAGYRRQGVASWYGIKFHGHKTANGEVYNMYAMTAAHKTLPLPSYARVTNTQNGRSVVVRVNDRGPFHGDRLIDLSWAAAKKLGYHKKGVAKVIVEGISPSASVAKSTAVDNRRAIKESSTVARNEDMLYLQVAALSSRRTATHLQKKLQGMTQKAVRIISGNDGLFRVRVGPFYSVANVEKLQQKLEKSSLNKGYRVDGR